MREVSGVSVSLVKFLSQQEAKRKHAQYPAPVATLLLHREAMMLPEETILGDWGLTSN